MKISEMIQELIAIEEKLGDVDVLVTDGYESRCYRGEYDIASWEDENGVAYVDIGIGGCLEDDEI